MSKSFYHAPGVVDAQDSDVNVAISGHECPVVQVVSAHGAAISGIADLADACVAVTVMAA